MSCVIRTGHDFQRVVPELSYAYRRRDPKIVDVV